MEIGYLAVLLTVLGGTINLATETKNKDRTGFRRITAWGYIALAIICTGQVIAIVKLVRDQRAQAEKAVEEKRKQLDATQDTLDSLKSLECSFTYLEGRDDLRSVEIENVDPDHIVRVLREIDSAGRTWEDGKEVTFAESFGTRIGKFRDSSSLPNRLLLSRPRQDDVRNLLRDSCLGWLETFHSMVANPGRPFPFLVEGQVKLSDECKEMIARVKGMDKSFKGELASLKSPIESPRATAGCSP